MSIVCCKCRYPLSAAWVWSKLSKHDIGSQNSIVLSLKYVVCCLRLALSFDVHCLLSKPNVRCQSSVPNVRCQLSVPNVRCQYSVFDVGFPLFIVCQGVYLCLSSVWKCDDRIVWINMNNWNRSISVSYRLDYSWPRSNLDASIN